MQDTVFLLVKATITTSHKKVHEAVTELQQQSTCNISDTRRVKVLDIQFLDYKLKP